jgi:hypothetical protein
MSCRIPPWGLSARNSKAAVSFSIKTFLTYNRKKLARHSRKKVSFLSAANNDLVSRDVSINDFTY